MAAIQETRSEQEHGKETQRDDVGAELAEMLGTQRRRGAVAEAVAPVITRQEADRQAEMRRHVPYDAGFEGMGI